jgi:recombination protein RecR
MLETLSPSLARLVKSLQSLPGIGPRSAQRMALQLLSKKRLAASALAEAIGQALDQVIHCQSCRVYTDTPTCKICADSERDHHLMCIVETPANLISFENTGHYQGLYFVLMGRLSPLDGIGPEALGLDQLADRLKSGQIKEVILAMNPTIEGEATVHYLFELVQTLKNNDPALSLLKVSRIAQGVPVGAELDFMDGNTLEYALADRRFLTSANY